MPRFDIHTQALPLEEQLTSQKFMTFGYAEGLGVKGFQMLIDLWLKTFLTRKGSDPTNLSRGTAFTNLIGSNTSLDEAEDVVRTCIDDCNQQVRTMQQVDQSLAATERLADARLLRYVSNTAAPGFDATIEIGNAAGQRLQFLLPDFVNKSR